MRYFFITVSICAFGLMGVAVVKGNGWQPVATAVAAEPVAKEKAELLAEESIDAGQRRFAVETAVQNFRISNEIYQFEIGTPGAKKLDESLMRLSIDKVKAKLDEMKVPQMPNDILAELEIKVNRQFDLGRKYGEQGRMDEMNRVMDSACDEFYTDIISGTSRGEKLSRREYYEKMLEMTDSTSDAMEKNL